MKTKTKLMPLLALLLLFPFATATDFFPLEDYPLYCEAHRISSYCDKASFEALMDAAETGSLEDNYENELAYKDRAVYTGELSIKSVNVEVDIADPLAEVRATYIIENPGEDAWIEVMALRVPKNLAVYENGVRMDLDDFYSWTSLFASGEKKEIVLEFAEGTIEDIYGYNTNLVFDSKIPSADLAETGTYSFTFPKGRVPGRCMPDEDSIEELSNGRYKVTWQKTDFAPWTNPFNDLICNWYDTPVEPAPLLDSNASAEQAADNTVLYLALGIILLAAGLFALKKKGKLGR